MKREHNEIEQSLPPFYENLVFWAPLTEGDLTDHIGGMSPTTDSGCSVTWDAVKGMYLLKCQSNVNYSYVAALLYEGLNLGTLQEQLTDGITISGYILEKSYSGNHYSAYFSCADFHDDFIPNTGRESNTFYVYNCGARYANSILAQHHRMTSVWKDNYIYHYYDGNLSQSSGWNLSAKTKESSSVGICQKHLNNTSMEIWCKDIRIYNRALTAEEVAQL